MRSFKPSRTSISVPSLLIPVLELVKGSITVLVASSNVSSATTKDLARTVSEKYKVSTSDVKLRSNRVRTGLFTSGENVDTPLPTVTAFTAFPVISTTVSADKVTKEVTGAEPICKRLSSFKSDSKILNMTTKPLLSVSTSLPLNCSIVVLIPITGSC